MLAAALLFSLCLVLLSCKLPEQLRAVQKFQKNSELVRIACLDVNADGRVGAADADLQRLSDITGDHRTDESDLRVVREVEIVVPDGRPKDCGKRGEIKDWQAGPPPEIDCAAGRGGFIVYGVGGGAVDLNNRSNAAGVRWMMFEIGKVLAARGVPFQLVSVAPGVNLAANPQPDAEAWAFAYVSQQLRAQPCLQLIMLGHSHGAANVTATATRLESAGLGDQVALSALIDRVTSLYAGDTQSIPQTSPVFNIFLASGRPYEGRAFDQPNVENWDATGQQAPEHGDRGGRMKPVTHTTIDNCRAVLQQIVARVLNLPM